MSHALITSDRQNGLSIIELMVALVIGLALLGGVVQIFLGTKLTYRTQEALSRLQESARFAVGIVNRDVRMAGYMGCLSIDNSSFTTKLNGGTDFAFDLGTPIEGFEANDTGLGSSYSITAENPAPAASGSGWTDALDPDLLGRVVPGTDVIVVRNASTTSYPLTPPFNDSAQLFITASNDFAVGDILIATDCVKSTVFQATSKNAAGTNITHSGASLSPGNQFPVWNIPAEQYAAGSEVMRAQTSVYYIGQGSSGPSLFRRSLHTNPATSVAGLVSEELVEGIESMQVVYGEDLDDDGAADNYVDAGGVTDWTQVRSVRIGFLIRSGEEVRAGADTATYNVAGTTVNPFDDRRLRDVVSTTVTLRNRTR